MVFMRDHSFALEPSHEPAHGHALIDPAKPTGGRTLPDKPGVPARRGSWC
jgi:hypothetical protein